MYLKSNERESHQVHPVREPSCREFEVWSSQQARSRRYKTLYWHSQDLLAPRCDEVPATARSSKWLRSQLQLSEDESELRQGSAASSNSLFERNYARNHGWELALSCEYHGSVTGGNLGEGEKL